MSPRRLIACVYRPTTAHRLLLWELVKRSGFSVEEIIVVRYKGKTASTWEVRMRSSEGQYCHMEEGLKSPRLSRTWARNFSVASVRAIMSPNR